MVISKSHKRIWFIARIIVIIILFINLIPIFWMILGSFKHNIDVVDPTKLLNFTFTLDNYKYILESGGFWRPLKNSILLSGVSTVFALILGVPAAYAFARWKMGKSSSIVLIIRMIPSMTFVLPWFIMFRSLGIAKSYLGLVLAFTVTSLPLIVWIMIPYFKSIPNDLWEAARIDGASELGTFLKITLPLSIPGIMTTAIMTVLGVWNNFLFVMILGSAEQRTLPMQLMNFIGESGQLWGKLLACATIITAPLILIAVFLQKYIVSGMTAGATKG